MAARFAASSASEFPNLASEPRYAAEMDRSLGESVEILLLEDDLGDVVLTRRALKTAKVVNNLHVVTNGEEGLAFLRREGEYADAPRPALILLDLNMPRMNGHEFLESIKDDPEFRSIPVVVLTTSGHDVDVVRSYELQAASYVQKPLAPADFVAAVRSFDNYWLRVVRNPTPS